MADTLKYFHIKEISVPIYDTTLVLIFTNDNEQLKPHFPDFDDKELYAITWVNDDIDDDKFYIGLNFDYNKKYITNSVVAHEGFHATNFILNSRGVLPEFLNDEPAAYLLDFVVNEIHKFAKEKNMKIQDVKD